jgi:NTE family protein
MEVTPSPGLAVALGSSFLGYYAHAGFLNGLAAAGVIPERISGASAGAISGSLFSAGLRGATLERAVLDPALRWSFFDWGALHRFPGVATGLGASGLLSGNGAIRHLRSLLGDIDLSSFASPSMEIAVTDAANHRPDILRSGPLAELIVASCAVPGLIRIQSVGPARYIDGGVACEIPFEQWLDNDSVETILIHRIVRGVPGIQARQTLFHAIGSVHRTVCGEFHRHRSGLAKMKGKRLIEIETATPAPALLSSRHSRECYNLGHASGTSAAAQIR